MNNHKKRNNVSGLGVDIMAKCKRTLHKAICTSCVTIQISEIVLNRNIPGLTCAISRRTTTKGEEYKV
jgi:hypothetical protein